ncbi:MAG: nitroreductase family protein [Peptoniphilaceae bacterium]|nr:nitroreductase family protein [Peptoniphilaceae bacterium]MDY6018550.1 nitroreductase family protein [Anaerococcus sp.]
MEFDKVLEKRVSTRKFLDEKLSSLDIEKLIDAAKTSPIGHGAYDTVNITVITNDEVIKAMSDEFKEKLNKQADPLFGAPCFIMVSSSKNDTCEYEDCGCIIQTICLKATEMGLGSCYIRGLVHALGSSANYIKSLNLPDGFRPISGLVVGKIDHELVGKSHDMKINYVE